MLLIVMRPSRTYDEFMKKILVIGGGFGGLNCARSLAGHKGLEISLIDRRNYHLFQPLLYQVATAGLSPAEIATPIRSIFTNNPDVRVILDNVVKVDRINKKVTTSSSTYEYDYLVLACGAKHSYFGHSEWEEFAPGLKTLEQATEIRRRILQAFEDAEKESDPETQKKHLTFIVVGGGPTGVELAGAIAEIARQTLEKDFRRIDPSRTRVILVEAGPKILSAFTDRLSKRAINDLEKMGVQVWTNTRVSRISESGVEFGNEKIAASTILWAAGVQPSSLCASLDSELDAQGRIIVAPDLSLKVDASVFCIGDMARFDRNGKPLPGLAPVAIQQGRQVAKNILNDMNGRPRGTFHYVDKGQMATIGRKKAVLQFKGIEMGGLLAWLAWLFIHIYYLIGFKNRIFVFFQWAWAYLTLKRGARLIVDKEWRSKPAPSMMRPRH